jgi:hypothetical protein
MDRESSKIIHHRVTEDTERRTEETSAENDFLFCFSFSLCSL